MKNSKLSSRSSGENLTKKIFIKQWVVYFLWFCLISAILLLIASFVLFKLDDPFKYVNIATKATTVLTSFICGFLLGKNLKERFIPCGISLGCIIVIFLSATSLFIGSLEGFNPLWCTIILFCTTFGSLFSRLSQSKPKHKRHKK